MIDRQIIDRQIEIYICKTDLGDQDNNKVIAIRFGIKGMMQIETGVT